MLEDTAAQRADIVPQGLHPGEGGLLQLVHVVGCTAAAALARECTVAVPRVAAQRLAPFDWEVMGSSRMKPWKPQPPRTHSDATGPSTYVQHLAEFGWCWTVPPREIVPPTGTRVEIKASAK